MDARIRPAAASDILSLVGVIARVFEEYGLLFVARDEVPDLLDFEEHYLRDGRGRLLVADIGQGAVGCCALRQDEQGAAFLSRVYLDARFRRKGLGSAMSLRAMAEAREAGHRSVYLWTDTRFEAAHRMYESLGFVRTGRIRALGDANETHEHHCVCRLDVCRLDAPLRSPSPSRRGS